MYTNITCAYLFLSPKMYMSAKHGHTQPLKNCCEHMNSITCFLSSKKPIKSNYDRQTNTLDLTFSVLFSRIAISIHPQNMFGCLDQDSSE